MYIYGRNPIFEALNSDAPIEKIYIQYSAQGGSVENIRKFAKMKRIACTVLDNKTFIDLERQSVPKGENTQGVLALRQIYKSVTLEEYLDSITLADNPVILIADSINDPHNFGAMVRSAECAGVTAIMRPARDSAPVSPAVMKTSAGALEYVEIITVPNLTQAIEHLKEAGFWIFGTDMVGDKNHYDNIYDCPVALIIGSEGRGIRPAIRKHCDVMVQIPMAGKTDSLNASVAAGILMFEIARQRAIKA